MSKKEIKRNYIPCRAITEAEKIQTRKKYELTLQKIKQYEKREIDEKYTAYDKLSDYDRQCLIATNYFRVLWGDNFIDVPTQDLRFWFYFDEKCFDLAPEWQRTKKPDFVERNKKEAEAERLSQENKKIEIKMPDVITEHEPETEIEKVAEIIENPKKEETEMPIEENKDFLKEKQEHPIYPKRETVIVKSDSEIPIEDKSVKGKKGKKEKPKKEDSQGSLF